jgi:hypothetical protein
LGAAADEQDEHQYNPKADKPGHEISMISGRCHTCHYDSVFNKIPLTTKIIAVIHVLNTNTG